MWCVPSIGAPVQPIDAASVAVQLGVERQSVHQCRRRLQPVAQQRLHIVVRAVVQQLRGVRMAAEQALVVHSVGRRGGGVAGGSDGTGFLSRGNATQKAKNKCAKCELNAVMCVCEIVNVENSFYQQSNNQTEKCISCVYSAKSVHHEDIADSVEIRLLIKFNILHKRIITPVDTIIVPQKLICIKITSDFMDTPTYF